MWQSKNAANSPSTQDHVKGEQDPWQVHRLELCAEPKLHSDFTIQLTPHVQHGHDHAVEQEVDFGEERQNLQMRYFRITTRNISTTIIQSEIHLCTKKPQSTISF